ncbi:MAG: LEA type 2 family protein [Chlamydiae bacterium]|nr:LEA type 2 family protein [Chlamydiota bacterium]
MIRNIAIFGGLGIIGFGLYSYFKRQYELLTEFDWKVINLSFDQVSPNLLKGKIVFRFTNKADIEITISKFYMDLYLNNKYIGWIEDRSEFVIPAKGFSDIPIGFSVNPQLIISNVLDIITLSTKLKDAIFSFDGAATIRSGFVSTSIKLKCDCSVKNYDCKC